MAQHTVQIIKYININEFIIFYTDYLLSFGITDVYGTFICTHTNLK